jgi:hypothetical protein
MIVVEQEHQEQPQYNDSSLSLSPLISASAQARAEEAEAEAEAEELDLSGDELLSPNTMRTTMITNTFISHPKMTQDEMAVKMPSYPSLCIPIVSASVNKEFVENIFNRIGLGKVARVDVLSRTNFKTNVQYNRVFIHFDRWNIENESIQKLRSRVINGGHIKIVYDNPWFWKCSASRYSNTGGTSTHNSKSCGGGPSHALMAAVAFS